MKEDPSQVIVIIGSISYRRLIAIQLEKMGFYEGQNCFWLPNWHGDGTLPPFYYEKNRWPYLVIKRRDNHDNKYFSERIELISHWIGDRCDSLLDVGAGKMLIRKYCRIDRYIPLEFAPYAPESIVCHLDEHEFPDVDPVDYALVVGTLEHVRDWKWLLRKVTAVAEKVIIGCNPLEVFPDIGWRANHCWVSHFYTHELILYMQELGFYLTKATEQHRVDNIYLFEKCAKMMPTADQLTGSFQTGKEDG